MEPHDDEEEHGGPSKRDAEVHENADKSRRHTAIQRGLTEQSARHSLEETRHSRVVEGDAQDAREESIRDAGQKAGAHHS